MHCRRGHLHSDSICCPATAWSWPCGYPQSGRVSILSSASLSIGIRSPTPVSLLHRTAHSPARPRPRRLQLLARKETRTLAHTPRADGTAAPAACLARLKLPAGVCRCAATGSVFSMRGLLSGRAQDQVPPFWPAHLQNLVVSKV